MRSTKRRCKYCGETLVIKEIGHGLRGPVISFFKHPACERALKRENQTQ